MRYFVQLQYNGANYHGWQKQPDAITVQEKLDQGLSKLLNQPIESVGSGRTDKGVHAKAQIAHFDTNKLIPENFAFRLNAVLPFDIVIDKVVQVQDEAHARFDAESRAYQYYLSYKNDPFLHGLFYKYTKQLDFDLMNEACKVLFKHKDFESFSKVHTDVKTFNCDIFEAYWKKENQQYVFYIKANRFLRNMVRAIVGTLLEVGTRNISIQDFEHVILAKDRCKAGTSVPAEGLFLSEVNYPSSLF